MSASSNIQMVQTLYEAFGKGDVDTILSHLTDDVDWAADGPDDAAPWYGTRRGKEQVTKFFTDFGSAVELSEFAPLSFAGNDTDVLVLLHITGTVRATGKPLSMHLHHYFRFRGDAVEYYRGSEDSAQTAAALRP